MDLSSIPSSERCEDVKGIFDRLMYHIRDEPHLHGYVRTFDELSHCVSHHCQYSAVATGTRTPVYIRDSNRGIDLVRRIRNKFAHGAVRLPTPDESCDPSESRILCTSSRIVLLT